MKIIIVAIIAFIIYLAVKDKNTESNSVGDWIRKNVESTRKPRTGSYNTPQKSSNLQKVTSRMSPPTSPESYMENNTIRIKDHASFSYNYGTISFGDGRVICNYSNGVPGVIGYYEADSTSSNADTVHVTVQAQYDKREIGSFDLTKNDMNCLIFLSNAGWYKIFNSSDHSKKPYSLLAAEMWIWNNNSYITGIIEDIDTREQIAEYKGNPIGAAAAFVCMYYELADRGKYRDFYHG